MNPFLTHNPAAAAAVAGPQFDQAGRAFAFLPGDAVGAAPTAEVDVAVGVLGVFEGLRLP